MLQHGAETDAELLEALARWRRDQPPAPSQPFTIQDIFIFDSHLTRLYDEYERGAGGCVYFFSEPRSTMHCLKHHGERGWKVAGRTRWLMDGGGREVGSKDTLAIDELDEFNAKYENYREQELCLYRLHRLA
ncbi:hypothetical protein BS78_05G168600 [Paspalum vaginatum]|nr:hypothetical protein BS78_05G168600 [Paspalum vaginatum]